MFTSLKHRAGRRGAFLLFLAVLDFAYGYSLLTTSAVQQRAQDLLLPWQTWGIIWLVIGTTCLAGAFARRDRIAFTLAAALKMAWAMLYAQLWIIQAVPRAWVAATIWAAFSLTVLLISGWPEPAEVPKAEKG